MATKQTAAPRRGRPPTVHGDAETGYSVSVKGNEFKFRATPTGGIRKVSGSGDGDDATFAREQVERAVADADTDSAAE